MTQVVVDLGERSYPIHIATGNLKTALTQLPGLKRQVMVVTNTTVAPLYLEQLTSQLSNSDNERKVSVHTLQDGEQFKSLNSYHHIMDQLITEGFNRDCALIALGGGVVGDITGFVAATFQRGVDFYQIPTTLLAQVDSSVGGKTAINHPQGKNLIGAFYQPQSVLIDTECLTTLSERDYLSGLAEVIKYGIIYDAEFFNWLEGNATALKNRDNQALIYAIQRSCEIKAEVVAADERESGIRALLNLGHTFGHAIEAATEYGSWTHGEAVAAGTIIASKLSEVTQRLAPSDFRRIVELIQTIGLPTVSPNMPFEQWLTFMRRDKKVKDSVLHFVLPTGIGAAAVVKDIDEQTLDAVITECC